MRVYIFEDLIRNGNIWVEQGTYDILRRFDETRWLIILSNRPKTEDYRLLTLVSIDDMEFVK